MNIYDSQFRGNILVVGKTGCEKTYFLENLKWISSIEISQTREPEIQSSFSNEVEFYQASSAD